MKKLIETFIAWLGFLFKPKDIILENGNGENSDDNEETIDVNIEDLPEDNGIIDDDTEEEEWEEETLSPDRQAALNEIEEFAANRVRTVNQVAVHCTATKEGQKVTIEDIDKWHKERGFSKQPYSGHYCGYHFVIALDGTIMQGRKIREKGAHVTNFNANSIGVCYVGGLDNNGKAKDTRTAAQRDSLIWLISQLKTILKIKKVQGHRDYSPDLNGNGIIERSEWIKECPCFDAIPEYKDL